MDDILKGGFMACACKLVVGLWRCIFIRKLWVFLIVADVHF